ncbi:MAG: glycoside hydrolase family 127 protein [Candidatus Bathyarchaeia archaeon]
MKPKFVVVDSSQSPYSLLRPIPIDSVKLKDGFWAPRIKTLIEVTLPTQYEMLEETGRIDNFRRATRKIKAEFKGLFFNDSDVYKWIEATSYALAYDYDRRLEKIMDNVIVDIADAQDANGYLNTYFTFERKAQRWTNLRDMHELYCAGHLIQAAVAHYRATGKRTLLDVSIKLANHILSIFGPGKRQGVPGHPEVEMALVELYRTTRMSDFLSLAKFFIDNRGRGLIGGSSYHIDHKPFRELDEIVGHAVRSVYLNCGATDVYMETGDESLLKALERLWQNMVNCKMYVTGGLGSRYEGEAFGENYELPNRRAYAETCAAVANVMWNWRMLLATGKAEYADIIELALYNGALAGIGLDGETYFYVNPLADRGAHRRSRWFDCACCPPNIARLIASVSGYFYSTSQDGIWIHIYATNETTIEFNGGLVKLTQNTDYPWDGHVEITVYPEKLSEFSIFLRIPGWSLRTTVALNGEPLDCNIKPPQYLEVKRTWEKGDVISMDLDMRVNVLLSHPHVLENFCRIALKRGPFVYCVEQADNPGFDVWNLIVSPNPSFNIMRRPDLLGGIRTIECDGFVVNKNPKSLYSSLEETTIEIKPVKFTAIPYYAWANREPGPMVVWIPMFNMDLIKRYSS